LRLLRIRHLARLPRMVDSLHAKYGFPLFTVEIGKFFLITLLTVHWMACIWCMAEGQITNGHFSYHTDQATWLSALIATKGDSCLPSAEENSMCVYLLALYWAVMTLTSVGYGDVTPQNPFEYAVCTVCMFVVGYVWAYIVGSIVSLLSSLDPYGVMFRQHVDELNSIMDRSGMPRPLQEKLRSYMHHAKQVERLKGHRAFLQSNISQGLQREVAACSAVVKTLEKQVYWASDLDKDVLLDIVRALAPQFFGPREAMLLRQNLIVIRKGLAAANGRILGRGDVWGLNDILLETEQLVDGSVPRTLSYVDVLSLDRQSLLEVCQRFPAADRRLRHAQVRTAAFRAFCAEAKRRKQLARPRTLSEKEQRYSSGSFAHPGQDDGLRAFHDGPSSSERGLSAGDGMGDSDLRQLVLRLAERQEALSEKVDRLAQVISQPDAAAGPPAGAGLTRPITPASKAANSR